ncbi:MAG: DUF3943 domain-containing protein [Ferruginibacter sp.]
MTSAQTTDTSAVLQKDSIVQTPLHNMYGDLLDDDPVYNPRYVWWKPAIRILSANLASWASNRYLFKVDWTSSGASDWKNSFDKGPEWDTDGFGINFIGHPHSGSYYHNIARSNGYSYWQTLPYALWGSLTWEYFGENTRPSYNDMINTPISGMFLGEIFYRISSNILDDRSRGRERVFREIVAGIISPTRAMNRLTQGKMTRITTTEVYQKEPLNITVNGGAHRINNETDFGSGGTNAHANIQLDYGNPFETRRRKPFDIFRLRIEGSIGTGKKLLENVNGYGILFGRNIKKDRILFGAFQHYDYWNNNVFEVGALGFGAGIITKTPVARHSNIYSTIHLGIVPLAGNNTRYGPDTSSFRHYNFGGGFQAKEEETFNLNNWATIGFTGFYYWIHTYDGIPGNSLVGILKPYITVRLYKNLSIGFEHLIYHNDRYLKGNENLHLTRTEQKLFLQLFLEDRQRNGKYH